MKDVSELLLQITDQLPAGAGGPESGLALVVTDLNVALPIEFRLGENAELLATAPRGRMATGFQVPHSRLSLRFEVRGDE